MHTSDQLGQVIPSSVAMCSVILTFVFPDPGHAQSKGSNWYVVPAIAMHIVILVYINTRQRIWTYVLQKPESLGCTLLLALLCLMLLILASCSLLQLMLGIFSVLHGTTLYIVRYSVIALAGVLTTVDYTWDLSKMSFHDKGEKSVAVSAKITTLEHPIRLPELAH
ncbi:hypothetical protein M422DRAFT_243751 [Sphaerobolus stellatus SS14]|nr:hypothetical protein M422DRAFT_243751 [Sphaerobolus stellatus SS14]